MEDKREYCVYKHTSKIDGRAYVGITRVGTKQRWHNGKGYKRNQYFWRYIQKYGWDSLQHEVLYDNLTEEEPTMFFGAEYIVSKLAKSTQEREQLRGTQVYPQGEFVLVVMENINRRAKMKMEIPCIGFMLTKKKQYHKDLKRLRNVKQNILLLCMMFIKM